MKNKITTLLLGVILSLAGYAQTNSTDSLKAIYDSLPSSLLPTGLLHNRSPLYQFCFAIDTNLQWQVDSNYVASPYLFPGSIPAPLIKKQHFGWLYNDMWHSSINPQLLADAPTYRTRDSIARSTYEVPIAALHLDFNRILPGAVDSGYLYYDTLLKKVTVLPDTVWFDKPNNIFQYYANPDSLAQLAFATYQTFAGALTSDALYKAGNQFTVTFGLVSSLFASNQSAQLTYSEMDFDNGQGFQQVQFDVPKTIGYNATNWESYERILRLRLHYGQQVFEIRMPLVIVPNVKPADDTIFTSTLPLQCNIPTNGFVANEARASIRYGNPAKKLLKPVIICEGFESAAKPYGYNTYESISKGEIYNSANERIFEQATLLKEAFDSLTTLGYDIIYIDNKNHQDYIQANALNVIKVIQWANAELLKNNSSEKLVVIGASMGGLVARYALAKMEADGCCHNTRVYVTFDSPHNGANIPLGIQYSVRHLNSALGFIDQVLWQSEKVKPNWDALNSIGARQMLVAHIEPDADAVRAAFVSMYDSLGQPQQCRRIALINGSEKGLTNTITTSNKQYLKATLPIPLPFHHFVGITWQPYANIIGIPLPFELFQMAAYAEANGIVFDANNPDAARILSASILLTHGVSAAAQVVLKSLSLVPFLCTPCFLAPVLPIQAVTNITLPIMHFSNAAINTLTPSQYSVAAGFLNYSEAPGSLSNNPQTIAKTLNSFGLKLATDFTPYDGFIPSVSALDLDTNDLYLNIKNKRSSLMDRGKLPFDTYWAPGRIVADGVNNPDRNMMHIAVTKENYTWLIEQIDLNDELRHPQTGAYQKTLAGYYNFGRPADFDKPFLKHLYSVDIVNGGNLHINKSGVIGYSGGSYYASAGSSYACYTGLNCEQPHVNVQNGGLFEVGENLNNNRGQMYFQENSTLEIHAGGTLRMNDNSKLVIEPGATLILHPGAVINLAGANAVLELQGKVVLLDSAHFEPTGTGIVRFAQAMANANVTDYWQVGKGCKLAITGTNKQKRAEIVHNFYSPKGLDSIAFVGVTTTLAPDKKIEFITAPLTLRNSNFVGADTTQKHSGVHVYGQKSIIEGCRFSHGDIGLEAMLAGSTLQYVYLNNCTFTHNTMGGYVYGGSFRAEHCTARYNNFGFIASNTAGHSEFVGGIYAHNLDYGLSLTGQGNAIFELNEVAINNNNVGVQAKDGWLRAKCSHIATNSVGIICWDGSLFLDDVAQNELTNNDFAIILDSAYTLTLAEGLNDFSGSSSFIQGTLRSSSTQLDVSNNLMPATWTGTSWALPMGVTNVNGAVVYPTNYTSNPTMPLACAPLPGSANGNGLASGVLSTMISGRVVQSIHYTNIYLHHALADAAYMVSTPENVYNDLLAIARFNEILSSITPPFTENENLAISYATDLMVTALNNAYDQEIIPRNGAQDGAPENAYLQIVTSQIADQMGATGITANQLFGYNLLLAQTYRMAEHFDYAMQVLDSAGSSATYEQFITSEYWNCVCQAEDDLLKELVSPEDFAINLEICQGLLQNLFKTGFTTVGGTTPIAKSPQANSLVYPLYPNPASSSVLVAMQYTDAEATLQLYNSKGQIVQKATIPANAGQYMLPLHDVTNGVYSLKITQRDATQTLKLVVAK